MYIDLTEDQLKKIEKEIDKLESKLNDLESSDESPWQTIYVSDMIHHLKDLLKQKTVEIK